jgi:hypothetical protein
MSRPPEWEGADPGECADGADNDGNGFFDCVDPACAGAPECQENQRPAGHAVRIDPAGATTGDDLLCVVEAAAVDPAAVDPDGDAVDYSYAWDRDGESADIAEATVSAVATSKTEVWTCRVTPSDPFGEGPFASASMLIKNIPPDRS